MSHLLVWLWWLIRDHLCRSLVKEEDEQARLAAIVAPNLFEFVPCCSHSKLRERG